MTIETLTYFETIDVEKRLGEAHRDARGLLWTVNILRDMLEDTEHAVGLATLAEALQASDAIMDLIWSEIIGRQAEIEEADITEERAARREQALVMA